MKQIVLKILDFYQAGFSPDHSFWGKRRFPHGYCRFHPSCSEYTRRAIQKFGVARGFLLGVRRIFRCNPFSPIGIDEP